MTDIPKKKQRQYSVDAFSSSYKDTSGRSYVSMAHRPSMNNLVSPTITSGQDIHEESVNLASAGLNDSSDSMDGIAVELEDTTPLIDRAGSPVTYYSQPFRSETPDSLPEWTSSYRSDLEAQDKAVEEGSKLGAIAKPISYLPAVFLGLLLNILDGLSYGMIMFPVSDAVFSQLAPAGLSMFYVSCIISQIVFSLGGSAFKAGIGSEMIEVTPFFHTMALAITQQMSGASNDAIIATTIVSYAVSALVTGSVFWILGKCRLGKLVGFFPRHILVGCIGGVGYFLIATGIEVSSRLDGSLQYDYETFSYLFGSQQVVLQWTVPLALATLLVIIENKVHNSLVIPGFFILVFIVFHLVVALVPQWSLDHARETGWIFPAVDSSTPWYEFYSLYKLNLVNWMAVIRQFPTMLALTFFGILHVPINVPALAVTVGMDQFDVDRELVAHGYSNFLSGCFGAIQNYLVYTNSVMFIRAGADSRLAGVMLAIATAAIMMAGPGVIGFIPVCVVGSLIYLLGYELMKEALYDTWGRLRPIEYATVVIIVITMGAIDFVFGILVGILLACLSFVVEAARRPVVSSVYTGTVARSTVLRHTQQQEFLSSVGQQICIVKLQGTLFFGSIGGVESAIRERFDQDNFRANPIKFLIIDMKGVQSIDFSAAEGFRRILNLTNDHYTQLIFSSVEKDDDTIKALRDAGLWDNTECPIQLFGSLNYALEWCENRFLHIYKQLKKKESRSAAPVQAVVPKRSLRSSLLVGTPRSNQVMDAASRAARDETSMHNRYYNHQGGGEAFNKQPLPLLMITLLGLSDKDEQFWSAATKYFAKETVQEGTRFYSTASDEPAFFIVEYGRVRSILNFEQEGKEIHSSIVANTAFGDIFDQSQYREIIYEAACDAVVWVVNQSKLKEMHRHDEAVFKELLLVCNKLTKERFDTMMSTLIITGD